VSPGGLQHRAEPLQALRTTDSEDRPHDRREISRRDHHQVSLRDARESSQPHSSRPAGVADMSKESLRELASQSRELLASVALRSPSRVGDGPLACWSFVSATEGMKRKTSLKISSGSRLCIFLTQEWPGTGSVGPRPRKSPCDRLSVHRQEIDPCDFKPSK